MIHNNPDRPLARTGNRHGGLAVSPYNVYACKDGWFAIICNNDAHWRSLTEAIGRPELATDPRFATNADRVAHMNETDAAVEAWSAGLTRAEIFAATGAHGVPSAPVRDLHEVLGNPHLRERGMIEQIEHPRLGPISVPNSPMRYHGTPQTPATPSPDIGADNAEVFAELLGLGADEVQVLRDEGVI
jgi:CoA:oxalate CoA-transferase